MNQWNTQRGALLLTLAAIAATFGAAPRDAVAGDRPAQPGTPVKGTSSYGYPRSDEGAPPPYGHADGYGEKQGASGMNYDSNYVIWDGFTQDVIVYDVFLACIDGRGHESDDDGEADTKQLTAWGTDKVTFTAPGDPATTEIIVHNPIDLVASWHLRGNGNNYVDVHTLAFDILGGRHVLHVQASTSVIRTADSDEKLSTKIMASSGGSVGVEDGGKLTVTGDAEGNVAVEVDHTQSATAKWTEGEDVQGSAAYAAFVMKSAPGTSLTVEIQTEESMTVSAQSKSPSANTTADVTHHDTDNVVTGSYVTASADGPGTPGGDNASGPGTPGGDNGGTPSTGSTPQGGDGSTTTGGDGSVPPAPPEPPREPVMEQPGPAPEPAPEPEDAPEVPPAPPQQYAPPEIGISVGG